MIIVILAIALNSEKIYAEFSNFFQRSQDLIIPEKNGFVKDTDYMYLDYVEEFKPQNYHDLVNIFYSVLNNGWEEFTFYCPESYESCIDDIAALSFDEVLLSHINNFVHPYNSYYQARQGSRR